MVNQDEAKKLKRIRFEQRLENFNKAYAQFEDILSEDTEHNIKMRTALVQAFEFTLELSWNIMRDRFESEHDPIENEEVVFPRQAIQAAYDAKYIDNVDPWTTALKNRNSSSHAYDEKFAINLEKFIRLEYAPALKKLHEYFNKPQDK